jgi:hypothetical protein
MSGFSPNHHGLGLFENGLEGVVGEEAEEIVAGEAVAGRGRAGDTAEETRDLARSAECGLSLINETLDLCNMFEGEGGLRGSGNRSGTLCSGMSKATAAVTAVCRKGFAKV